MIFKILWNWWENHPETLLVIKNFQCLSKMVQILRTKSQLQCFFVKWNPFQAQSLCQSKFSDQTSAWQDVSFVLLVPLTIVKNCENGFCAKTVQFPSANEFQIKNQDGVQSFKLQHANTHLALWFFVELLACASTIHNFCLELMPNFVPNAWFSFWLVIETFTSTQNSNLILNAHAGVSSRLIGPHSKMQLPTSHASFWVVFFQSEISLWVAAIQQLQSVHTLDWTLKRQRVFQNCHQQKDWLILAQFWTNHFEVGWEFEFCIELFITCAQKFFEAFENSEVHMHTFQVQLLVLF